MAHPHQSTSSIRSTQGLSRRARRNLAPRRSSSSSSHKGKLNFRTLFENRSFVKNGFYNRKQGKFNSVHVLMNNERGKHLQLEPLIRSKSLDEEAQRHARFMAEAQHAFPSTANTKALKEKLGHERDSNVRVAENVFEGTSIRELHRATMEDPSQICSRNILAPVFSECGVGTARGADGRIYMVQLFRGNYREPEDN